MKILFVTEYFPPHVTGGGEVSCYMLAKYLVKSGVNVTVLTSKFKGVQEEEILEGINVKRLLKTGGNPESIFSNVRRYFFNNSLKKELVKLIGNSDFDIVHFFNITSMPGAKALEKYNLPLIGHINSPVIFDPIGTLLMDDFKGIYDFKDTITRIVKSKYIGKIKNRFFLRFNPLFWFLVYRRYRTLINSLEYFDFLTPISTDAKNKLIKINFPENKIGVVPNIFEYNLGDKKVKIPKDKLRILYLGSYTEFKGVMILLDSLKKLTIPYEADFYGTGNLENYLKKEVKKENLPIRINPSVSSKEVIKVIGNYDVLVVPSIYFEAFGRVALEAMSQGKVVIASEIGGLKEIIQNNHNGILVKPGDCEDLVDSIEKVYLDEKLYKKLGTNGLKSLKKYSGSKVSNDLIKFYKNLK